MENVDLDAPDAGTVTESCKTSTISEPEPQVLAEAENHTFADVKDMTFHLVSIDEPNTEWNTGTSGDEIALIDLTETDLEALGESRVGLQSQSQSKHSYYVPKQHYT
jgi:hypothetical protein